MTTWQRELDAEAKAAGLYLPASEPAWDDTPPAETQAYNLRKALIHLVDGLPNEALKGVLEHLVRHWKLHDLTRQRRRGEPPGGPGTGNGAIR